MAQLTADQPDSLEQLIRCQTELITATQQKQHFEAHIKRLEYHVLDELGIDVRALTTPEQKYLAILKKLQAFKQEQHTQTITVYASQPAPNAQVPTGIYISHKESSTPKWRAHALCKPTPAYNKCYVYCGTYDTLTEAIAAQNAVYTALERIGMERRPMKRGRNKDTNHTVHTVTPTTNASTSSLSPEKTAIPVPTGTGTGIEFQYVYRSDVATGWAFWLIDRDRLYTFGPFDSSFQAAQSHDQLVSYLRAINKEVKWQPTVTRQVSVPFQEHEVRALIETKLFNESDDVLAILTETACEKPQLPNG